MPDVLHRPAVLFLLRTNGKNKALHICAIISVSQDLPLLLMLLHMAKSFFETLGPLFRPEADFAGRNYSNGFNSHG